MTRKPGSNFTRFASCFTTVCSLLLLLAWLFSMWQSHVEDGGIALIAQGNALMKTGDTASLQKAVQDFQKAADTFHGIASKKEARNEGLAYYNMAHAYHALKNDNQAIAMGLRALPLLTDSEARTDQADMYGNLGLYYLSTNQSEKALEAYTRAQTLYEAVGLNDKVKEVAGVEGDIRYNQGIAAIDKQDWTAARHACRQAQQLYHQAVKSADEADACHELSIVYAATGDNSRAAEARQQEQALRPAVGSNPRR